MSQTPNIVGVLTKGLVLNKTKCDTLQAVKNLNLWGNELQDLRLIRQMPNLEVVSLSVNCISSLREFTNCTKLQELYLRKNNIQDIKEIKYLFKLPQLKVLWLHDNPCANIPHYREIVIKHLPKLTKLDNTPITGEERVQAQNVAISLQQGDGKERDRERQKDRDMREIREIRELKELKELKQREHREQPRKSNHNSSFVSEKRILTNRENKEQNIVVSAKEGDKSQKTKHVLDAIFSLYKLLDEHGLEIAGNQCNRMLTKMRR